jgi:parallel beta-helix repeat protein
MRHRTIYALLIAAAAASAPAGDLNPPGAPASTMVDLDDLNAGIQGLETRIAIDTLPAGGGALHQISVPGAYYLRQDLVGVAGSSGLSVNADDVTIDLNGFHVVGVAGAVHGINFGSVITNRFNVEVKNGDIRDWPSVGVGLTGAGFAQGNRLLNVHVEGCGSTGAQLGIAAVVRDCVFRSNGGAGLNANGAIENCVAESNAIGIAGGGSIRGCSVATNTSSGMQIFSGSVENCRSFSNGGVGIIGSNSVRIVDCLSHQNGGDGIQIGGDCYVSGCQANFNGTSSVGAGVHATGTDNRIEGNNVATNDAGIDCDSAGNVVIRNSASGNTDNYGQIVGGNDVGPIGTGATSTSPWANISF